MHRIVELVIQSLKNDKSYRLDSRLSVRTIFQVSFYRAVAILRGFWLRLWLGKSSGILFVGAHTRVKCPQLLFVGRSTILEEYVTIDALSEQGVRLGNNVTIAKYATIQCTGVIRNLGVGLTIGDNSAVGAYSFIGAQGGISIGKNVIIGPRVSFHAENHLYSSLEIPIRLQGEERKGIIIEDDCWIGAGSIILDGVKIGTGCVVAAGSVVTKSFPVNSVIAGVPARIIKGRQGSRQEPT
jgi:acetyltransferase-like isoleucine patch superfamily enzyme